MHRNLYIFVVGSRYMDTKLPKSIYRSFIVGITLLISVFIPAGLSLILGLIFIIIYAVTRHNFLKRKQRETWEEFSKKRGKLK